MGLIELTFGSNGERALETSAVDFMKNPEAEAEFRVIKTDQFFGTKELCVMGKLTKGVIARTMITKKGGMEGEIVTVESSYGKRPVSKPGTRILLMVSNLKKQDIQKDETLIFRPKAQEEGKKPKGRIIIA